MANCVFCKIVAGEIPCYKVYEDEHNLAFLDIQPQAQGHTVVIPKKHGETVFDLEKPIIKSVMAAVQESMKKIQHRLSPDGFNVGWNHLAAGGQVVPHLHLHVIPRYKDDGGGSLHSVINNPGRIKVEDVAKMLK